MLSMGRPIVFLLLLFDSYNLTPTVPSTIIGTLSECDQNRLWTNMSLLFILSVFYSKYSQKSYLFTKIKLLKESFFFLH